MRRLALDFGFDGKVDRAEVFEQCPIADELGIDSIWVAETFGLDAFVLLTQIAERTHRARLGTFVASVYSRSPAAMAQAFTSLDIASNGRVIAGIGVGTTQMATEWHGAPEFQPATKRLRDYVNIMRQVFDRVPLGYDGEYFHVTGGYLLRETPVQPHVPIGIGSMAPSTVKLTAELADHWYPQAIPAGNVASEMSEFRRMAAEAGRDPASIEVKSPGLVIATHRVEEMRRVRARYNAYAFRHVRAMHRQLERAGRGDVVGAIEAAWKNGGSRAAAEVVDRELGLDFDFVGEPEACVERIEQQTVAGVDLHPVMVDAAGGEEYAAMLKVLLG